MRTPYEIGRADGLAGRVTRLVRDPMSQGTYDYARGHADGLIARENWEVAALAAAVDPGPDAPPMFGYFSAPPARPNALGGVSVTSRVELMDHPVDSDAWCARIAARGVRRDRGGLPMFHWMIGSTSILVDLRGPGPDMRHAGLPGGAA